MGKQFKSEKGMALPTVIMVMLITFTLSAMVLSLATSQTKMEISYEGNTQALHAAEAGINKYLWSINKEGASVEMDSVITYPDVNPEYAFILHLNVDNNDKKEVTSTGWAIHSPEITQTVTALLTQKSYIQHVYFTNYEPTEPNQIWWQSGEKCYGPLRTNSSLYVQGNPIFYGEVYYAEDCVVAAGATPEFKKGKFQDDPLPLPSSNEQLKQEAENGGYYFTGRTSIMMNADGTLTIWNPSGNNPEHRTDRYTCGLPSNGVIYVNGGVSSNIKNESAGNVFISGTLKGRLTVGAFNDIYITDYNPTIKNFNHVGAQTNGVTYATTGFAFDADKNEFYYTGTGTDMLGLIANRNVAILTKGWFQNNDTQASAAGDIKVHAAVMAIGGSFMNSNHSEYPEDTTSPFTFPNLELRGAIIQQNRGAVGQTHYRRGHMSKVTGYNKDYAHDTRMMYEQPPCFLKPVDAGWEIRTWY